MDVDNPVPFCDTVKAVPTLAPAALTLLIEKLLVSVVTALIVTTLPKTCTLEAVRFPSSVRLDNVEIAFAPFKLPFTVILLRVASGETILDNVAVVFTPVTDPFNVTLLKLASVEIVILDNEAVAFAPDKLPDKVTLLKLAVDPVPVIDPFKVTFPNVESAEIVILDNEAVALVPVKLPFKVMVECVARVETTLESVAVVFTPLTDPFNVKLESVPFALTPDKLPFNVTVFNVAD